MVAAATAVLEVSGVQWATSKNVADAVLGRRPGVLTVDTNPVSQTATVVYDPARTDLRGCADGCATAASTAPGGRCPATSVTRWPRRPPSPTACAGRRHAGRTR